MNQLNREFNTSKTYNHSKLIFGAAFMFIISTAIAGYMIWNYLSFGQWTMDGVFQVLAKNIRTPLMDVFFRTITIAGETIPVIIFTAAIVITLAYRKKGKEAAIMSVFMIGVWRLNELIKGLLQRPRPDSSLHLTDISNYIGSSKFSMPSGHSMNFMALMLLTLYFIWIFSRNKKLNIGLTIGLPAFGILVGLSRVYLNVHYISDVITGWSLGAACTAAIIIVHRLLCAKK